VTHHGHKGRASHERWLVSYADFITLLFAFFVVLYAFSKANEKKQVEVSEAIDTAFRSFGVLSNASHQTPPRKNVYTGNGLPLQPAAAIMGESMMPASKVKEDLDHIQHELEKSLATQIANHSVAVEMGRDGLVISLREAGFFNSGSAAPHPNAVTTIRHVAEALGNLPYDVRIEGHTDNVPIHNAGFDSNWELSSARATLSAAGYAEYHPIVSNATPEGRAMNRRVDLVILPRVHINFASVPVAQVQGAHLEGSWARITDQ
jgi:chemotaxis protein MotB